MVREGWVRKDKREVNAGWHGRGRLGRIGEMKMGGW